MKNKDIGVIFGFIIISTRYLGVSTSKFRIRVTRGYSTVYEVYYVSMRIRRLIERIAENRASLKGEYAKAYLAGRVDGDGYVDCVKREVYIGASVKYLKELLIDTTVARNLGIETSITESRGVAKLRLKNPTYVSKLIKPYVLHTIKKSRILHLSRVNI